MKHVIIGTAGHVDHGKTALIGQLSGTNTDRLKEEQARGISIELGFAHMMLGDVSAGIVDVPGHEKFVRTMVAGAGGMDLALLVVAADEGVMPQTREHVEVLELLGVSRAVVALNKTDLVDAELAELAAEELREYLDATSLRGAPILPVSAVRGSGIEELRATLTEAVTSLPEKPGSAAFRLPIDRVFTLKGMGTVVTGTTWSGSVRSGDNLELMPRQLPVRVRDVHVHDKKVDVALAGQRTAIALHGVKHDELSRGEVLAPPGRLRSSRMVSLRVEALASNPGPLKQRSRIRFHFGTQEVLGRLLLLDRGDLPPGETCLAQARLEDPAVSLPGDRVILRFYSPMRTVAGATVIESEAPKRRHGRGDDLAALRLKESGDPRLILEDAVRDGGLGGLHDKEVKVLLGKYPGDDPSAPLLEEGLLLRLGRSWFHRDVVDTLAEKITESATDFHLSRPLLWGPGRESLRSTLAPALPQASFQKILEHLQERDLLRLRGEAVRVARGDPRPDSALEQVADKAERAWLAAGLAIPRLSLLDELGCPPEAGSDLLAWLVERGSLVRLSREQFVHSEALARLRSGLADLFSENEVLTVGEIGKHFEITRKYTVPLMEYCDARGWTVRREAERRRGPELSGNTGS